MSRVMRSTAQVTGFALMTAPLALVGHAAFANGSCQTTTPAATEVHPGVCEVSFTEAGDYTFTAPSGIEKLQAVVVGGGSAAWDLNGQYAGGGGDVQFFDDVDFSAPVELTVGAGGEYIGGTGEDSVINGDVVSGGLSSGQSGNGNDGVQNSDEFGSGGGAGGDASTVGEGGPGLTASEIADGSDLFPADDDELAFGAGGDSVTALSTTIDETPDVPGHGGNLFSAFDDGGRIYDGNDGVDGAVFLRWAVPLAATGFDSMTLIASGSTLVAGGAIVAATRRRAVRA